MSEELKKLKEKRDKIASLLNLIDEVISKVEKQTSPSGVIGKVGMGDSIHIIHRDKNNRIKKEVLK